MKKIGIVLISIGVAVVIAALLRKNPKPEETTEPVNTVAPVQLVFDPDSPQVKVFVDKLKADRTLVLEGEVNNYSMATLTQQLLQIKDNGEPIYLMINSPGGSIIAGEQFISIMESMKSPVNTVCTVLCASMAAHIHAHGVKRLALNRATLMYHDAAGGFEGELNKIISLVRYVKLKVDKLDSYIARRAQISLQEFQGYTKTELWIDAEDATRWGFNDAIFKPKFDPLLTTSTVDEKMFFDKGIKWLR